MRSHRLGLLFAMAVVFAGPATAQTVGLGEGNRFEFEYRYWRPKLGSDIRIGSEESFYPKEDLGVEDGRDSEYRGYIRFGRHVKIRGSYVAFDLQGAKTLENDVTYVGITFPEGTTVDTAMSFRHIKGGVEVDILQVKDGLVAVVADYSSSETEPVLTGGDLKAEKGKLRTQLLTLGLKARVYLTPGLSISLEASGMKKETTGVITDYEGVITYNLSRYFGVSFGYRNLYTKWLNDEDRAVVRFQGNFVSASIRF